MTNAYERAWGPIKRSKAKYKVVCAGRRTGKTTFLCEWVAEKSKQAPPRSNISVISPSIRRGMMCVKPRLLEMLGDRVKKPWAGLPLIEIEDGKLIFLKWAPARIVAIDEAAFVDKLMNLKTLFHRCEWAFINSTPCKKNWFYGLWRWGGRGKWAKHGWESWRLASWAFMPPKELQAFRDTMPLEQFQQEFEAKFIGSMDRNLREEFDGKN